ncbi:MAG: homocysteine S-methyltransferase family protein [Bacillota bacterium]|nr:homocysteine S-methyltransferase family protein [Bacillota bacterium]
MLLKENRIYLFDGGFGSQLQLRGMKASEIPEDYNIDHPEIIQEIHKDYLMAGSDFITTNTFGANPLKYDSKKYSFDQVIPAAIKNAKAAIQEVKPEAYIAYDIGPIGKLMEPMGSLTFDQVYDSVKSMVKLVKDDVDVFLLETMTDIYEVKASILAIKENCDKPVFVTMSFEAGGRSLSGCDPFTMVNVLEGLNVDALGINCSLGPKEMGPIIETILSTSRTPVLVQPNAGLPILKDGQTFYPLKAEDFVQEVMPYLQSGISIIGGCCGTTPDFIRALKENLPTKNVKDNVYTTRVSSGTQTVEFGHHVVVCGERLNPTGKKKLKAALKEERYDELVVEAIKQDQAGAHVLDVNVGLPGLDEPKVMKHVIKLLQEVIQLPLQIDSSDPQAIEQACRYYNGKPLINSVNGKAETMEAIFPIVKKYGGVVIGLTIDENGIPPKAEERFAIAKRIINKAQEYGIPKEDIIIDCLVLTASAQQKEVMETVKAVSMVKALGVHTVLGVSNVSFGLPNRPLLNKTFLAMAMSAGLDLPIINPMDKELMATIDAFNVLYNYDVDAKNYIAHQANAQITPVASTSSFSLKDVIVHGIKEEVESLTRKELESKEGLDIINTILIPTLDQIGKDYEQNKIFLPQLIQSAEASKVAFEVIKESFTSSSEAKGPVLIATVYGDVHDIGKNIVKVVCESYGFQMIDLGKDVAKETILEAFYKYQPKAIGLSALMTTTVISMEETIQYLKQVENMCPILVGGAVLTQDIAENINADFYTKDALDCVQVLNQIIN